MGGHLPPQNRGSPVHAAIASTLTDFSHPYLSGAWTPLHEEVDTQALTVIGTLPDDLAGTYIRNTENPVHQPIGRYHPFDGDGMIHAISFDAGRVRYRNRFVRTKGFLAEAAAGRALWAGLAEDPARSERPGWGAHGALKDSSSTDVLVHNGAILSTFYQCGEGYLLDPGSLETLGTAGWVPEHGISAHPKTDPQTGELLFFNYAKTHPLMQVGGVDAQGRRTWLIDVPLAGPRLPHDMAFTPQYAIVNDLPLFWDAQLLARNVHAARLHDGVPSRFALVPRGGLAQDIRWFEAAPTYVLHWINAFEDGDEVVLDGYFQDQPMPPSLPDAPAGHGRMMAYLDLHSMQTRMHRWRFNLRTGTTREEQLDPRIIEFGTIDQRWAGKRHRHVWSASGEPGWFLFNGLVHHDLASGQSETAAFGTGRFGSEAPFAPRLGSTREGDGYVLSFITDTIAGISECAVFDAEHIADGPVARVMLPHQISSGTHACWTPLGG